MGLHRRWGSAYGRALELCRETGTEDLKSAALFGAVAGSPDTAPNYTEARELADELLRTSNRCGRSAKVEVAGCIDSALCTKLFSAEFVVRCINHFERLMVLHVPGGGSLLGRAVGS